MLCCWAWPWQARDSAHVLRRCLHEIEAVASLPPHPNVVGQVRTDLKVVSRTLLAAVCALEHVRAHIWQQQECCINGCMHVSVRSIAHGSSGGTFSYRWTWQRTAAWAPSSARWASDCSACCRKHCMPTCTLQAAVPLHRRKNSRSWLCQNRRQRPGGAAQRSWSGRCCGRRRRCAHMTPCHDVPDPTLCKTMRMRGHLAPMGL